MRPTAWSLQTGCYCTSCIAASGSWPTAVSWVFQMWGHFQTLHGLDVICAELGWFCCNLHSKNKTNPQTYEYKYTHHNIINEKTQGLPRCQGNISHVTCSYPTYLLEAIVLVTVGTVPAVPIPIGHHCVLITEPAVHGYMAWLLSVTAHVVLSISIRSCWHISEVKLFPTVGCRDHVGPWNW